MLLVFQSCQFQQSIKPAENAFEQHQPPAAGLQADPALITGRLDNGFTYYLYANNEPRDRVSVHLNLQVGSIHEDDNEQGLAHFIEHMVYNGSTHFPPGELVKYFQSIGMQFGADANAHTGFTETVYDMLLPDGSAAQVEKALLVMKDFAAGALLLADEIEREKDIVLMEKRTRDSVAYRTFVRTLNFSLPGTVFARRLPIGLEKTIASADTSTMKRFYDTWYRPDKMSLVMVGNVDTDMVKTMIQNTFGGLSPRLPIKKEPDIGHLSHKGLNPFYHYEQEAGSTTVTLEHVTLIPHEKDTLEHRQKIFTEHMANMIIQNRLNKMTRQESPPFTSASIGSGTYFKNVEYAEISATCPPENWQASLFAIEQALRAATVHGVTQPELDRVKSDMAAALDNGVKSAATRASKSIAGEIISCINEDKVFQSPAQEQTIYGKMLSTMTTEDIHRALQRIWREDHRLILVTGNADLTDGQPSPEAAILAAYRNSTAIPVARAEAEEKAQFPYLPVPQTPGDILQKKDLTDIGISLVEFKNGVRLQLKKTDYKENEILFAMTFGNGRSDEPEAHPGLSFITAEVINESGLGAMDKETLEEALAGKNTKIVFGVDDGYFFFQGQSVPEEIDLLFQLLYAYIVDPGFSEQAFDLTVNRYDQRYQSLTRSVEGTMPLKGEQFLSGGDSRFGIPSLVQFKANTLADVRKWLTPSLTHDRLEISIVGDMDPDRVIQAARTFMGALPRRTPPVRTRRVASLDFPAGRMLVDQVNTNVPKGNLVLTYPTDEFWCIGRTRRLSALGAIVSERLRLVIREKLGAAYSPYAYNRPSQVYPFFGLFHVVVPIDPAQSDMVITEIKHISDDIREKGVTEEEVRLAVDPILTHIKDIRRTNGYWLSSVLKDAWRHPQQLGWSRTIEDDYASITPADIHNMALKYLRNENSAVILSIPRTNKNLSQ